MSDPRAIPDEERPFIPEERVPRQRSDDPMRADGSEATAHVAADESRADEEEDAIDVEDLP